MELVGGRCQERWGELGCWCEGGMEGMSRLEESVGGCWWGGELR